MLSNSKNKNVFIPIIVWGPPPQFYPKLKTLSIQSLAQTDFCPNLKIKALSPSLTYLLSEQIFMPPCFTQIYTQHPVYFYGLPGQHPFKFCQSIKGKIEEKEIEENNSPSLPDLQQQVERYQV